MRCLRQGPTTQQKDKTIQHNSSKAVIFQRLKKKNWLLTCIYMYMGGNHPLDRALQKKRKIQEGERRARECGETQSERRDRERQGGMWEREVGLFGGGGGEREY